MATKRLQQRHGIAVSSEHYLRAILELREERGYARVVDIATRVGVTKGSVSVALGHLQEKGLIRYDAARFPVLTTAGRRVAQDVRGRYVIVLSFLTDVLGLPAASASAEACRWEHVISHDVADRLLDFLRFFSETGARRAMIRRLGDYRRPKGEGWPESLEAMAATPRIVPLTPVDDDEPA